MSTPQSRKIALVGASGTIGSVTLSALLKSHTHTLTIISRAESTASFPPNVTVKKGDFSDESFLASALTGQDILVLQIGYFGLAQQTPLINAAAKAGVKYVLPTEFGSDPYSPLAENFAPMVDKKQYRELISSLGMSWIAVVNNPWFDWSLKKTAWGIDIASRKATLYSGAEAKFNTTTLHHVADGVASLLSLPDAQLDKFKNGPVYLSSFQVTQRDILDSAMRVTGTKESEWLVEIEDADAVVEESRKQFAAGNHMAMIKEFYIAHMRDGLGGNFQSKAARDAEVLGLKEDNLDDVVRGVVQELADGK